MRAMESCAEDLLRLGSALPADDEGLVVHRHELLEDLKVARRIVGRRQQATQDAGLVEDERLAALPVAAERGERLALHRHLLLVRLCRELLHRQQPLDERGRVLERERRDGVRSFGVLEQRQVKEIRLHRPAALASGRRLLAVGERVETARAASRAACPRAGPPRRRSSRRATSAPRAGAPPTCCR